MNQKEYRFSIIMTVYEQARELESNLPAFLTLAYEPDYEVIVVDESSGDDTEDVLKLMKQDYPHLYSTFLPRPNRQQSRPKLAYNIGLKASKYEWVIIADINHTPFDAEILQTIAEAMEGDTVLVLGYRVRKGLRLQTFSRMEDKARLLTGAYDFLVVQKDHAYEALKYFDTQTGRLLNAWLRLSVFTQKLLRL